MMVNTTTSKRSERLETEARCVHDEVLILKRAIEEAIIKGQKSFGGLSDITESGIISDEELDLVDMNRGSGVVGWVDNF
jgi:hypothetical protein